MCAEIMEDIRYKVLLIEDDKVDQMAYLMDSVSPECFRIPR